ncbi:hypothetical protein PV327_004285 [Microctonus hyperodae]|uniref:N-acetyltransferase domain-containing protein n=1 Tax=Microctonus hyperodae TaxID=165561 RepID=A0AA39FC23_MICHY|nr:hypothetical protein PV327_004285 [Microctonus hyperodae]
MGWSRPIGPLRVWRNIELINSHGNKIQISIEDIPEDQYPEVLDHMCTFFIKDETTLSSMNISEDPDAIMVLKDFWNIALKQRMAIGAFDKSENDENKKLVGVNILAVIDEDFDNECKNFTISNVRMKKFFNFLFEFSDEGDPRRTSDVNFYLSAFGLSVDPKYRCLGLGKQLLATRDDIGRVYNINLTETIFTSAISQKAAAAVGFKDHVARAYEDIVDEDGEKLFPSLAGKYVKSMMKHLQ